LMWYLDSNEGSEKLNIVEKVEQGSRHVPLMSLPGDAWGKPSAAGLVSPVHPCPHPLSPASPAVAAAPLPKVAGVLSLPSGAGGGRLCLGQRRLADQHEEARAAAPGRARCRAARGHGAQVEPSVVCCGVPRWWQPAASATRVARQLALGTSCALDLGRRASICSSGWGWQCSGALGGLGTGRRCRVASVCSAFRPGAVRSGPFRAWHPV
jgi:hypothetical protein